MQGGAAFQAQSLNQQSPSYVPTPERLAGDAGRRAIAGRERELCRRKLPCRFRQEGQRPLAARVMQPSAPAGPGIPTLASRARCPLVSASTLWAPSIRAVEHLVHVKTDLPADTRRFFARSRA